MNEKKSTNSINETTIGRHDSPASDVGEIANVSTASYSSESIRGDKHNESGFNPNGDSTTASHEYDIETELKKYQELFKQVTQWFTGILELIKLETSKNFKAYAKSLAFTLALLPLGIIFYVSFIGSISYLSYYFSESIFVGIGTLLLSQIAVLWYCFSKSTAFKEKIGYQQTKIHMKEAKDELVAIFGG